MSKGEGDLWDALWAAISLILGEATAFLSVYPTLQDVPGFSREGLTLGFGMLLSATYFLMGIPCIGAIKHGVQWITRKYHGRRQTSAEES